ncbi:MAG: AAA-like domain-containing protein [Proteobacteria bacterium]|nr:AAA-like domain-containing protein [Pseudomonadota bacterium]
MPMPPLETRTVLILGANPPGTERLRLDNEVREIRDALHGASHGHCFQLEYWPATRPRDLWRALLKHRPEIVHFIGHGTETEGLVLEGEDGRTKLVSAGELASLFSLFTGVECVLLNACYTQDQARAIAQHVCVAIGIQRPISDQASIQFAVGFYDSLGAGESLEFAYQLGCRAARFEGEQLDTIQKFESDRSDPVIRQSGQSRRARIFISFDRALQRDRNVAWELRRGLIKYYDVFPLQSSQGPDLIEQVYRIHREIQNSDVFIAILSQSAAHSELLSQEIAIAHELAGKQSGRPLLLPIRHGDQFPLPSSLTVYLDDLDWESLHNQDDIPRLVNSIAGGVLSGRSEEATKGVNESDPGPQASNTLPPPRPTAVRPCLEIPGGTMSSDSKYYVKRREDDTALRALDQQGVTIVITGARQMGKSSLLIQLLSKISAAKRVIYVDFQAFSRSDHREADPFYLAFCSMISNPVDMLHRIAEYQNNPLSNNQRCTYYLESILKRVQLPIVLAMDETESILSAPFRDDFFGMVRSWHNRRAAEPIWKNLDLMLVRSTDNEFITDPSQSPFNVGLQIRMNDFTPEHVAVLNRSHDRPFEDSELDHLIQLIGGHPYLVRQALYEVASKRFTVAGLFDRAADDEGPFGDHLRYFLLRLYDDPQLGLGLRRVISRQSGLAELDRRITYRLLGAGLIKLQGGQYIPRCKLYNDYFGTHLRD